MYLYLYLYQLAPYLIYSLLIYLPTVCRNQQEINHSFIHSSTPSLPPSLPIAGLVYVCICTYVSVRPCISVYIRVSVRVHVHTYIPYIQYPQKVHIKDTYQRYMYTCVLGYVVVSYFKNNICRSDRHKKPPDERPCTRPVFHNFTR